MKTILRHLDRELATVGATRGEGSNVKSVVRLLCESDEQPVPDEWFELASTCQLPGTNAAAHILGIDMGKANSASQQFRELSRQVGELHDSILQVRDTATELILLRRCADVCKVSHLLRANGTNIEADALNEFDEKDPPTFAYLRDR